MDIFGFNVIDLHEPRLLDLVLSCRVQGKRVEHAVVRLLLKQFLSGDNNAFHANYRRTTRNAAAGRVVDDIGFETLEESKRILSLVFKCEHDLAEDDIVTIGKAEAK